MPSFELKMEARVSELEGLRLSETQRVKEGKLQCSVEVTHARAQEEGLLPGAIDATKAIVIEESFVFVLTDANLEEKVENLPMFIAKVTPENFIPY